jgi:hypothetical protein
MNIWVHCIDMKRFNIWSKTSDSVKRLCLAFSELWRLKSFLLHGNGIEQLLDCLSGGCRNKGSTYTIKIVCICSVLWQNIGTEQRLHELGDT